MVNHPKEKDPILSMLDACIGILTIRITSWETTQNKVKKVDEFLALSSLIQNGETSINLLASAKYLISDCIFEGPIPKKKPIPKSDEPQHN